MPRDLFAVVRPPSRRRFRRTIVLVSSLGHIVALSLLLVAQVFAVGPLPQPRLPSGFEWVPARLADIELPPPPAERRPAPRVENTPSPDAAPIEPPTGITKESESMPPAASGPGVVPGSDSAEPLRELAPATPPPPPVVQPMRLHSGIQPPRKTIDLTPDYPAVAREAHIQGIVILEATISAAGDVQDARVLRSIPLLDRAAIDAVRQWKYTPALLNGVPVPVIITVTLNFRLQ